MARSVSVRRFYRIAALLPLAGLAVAAVLHARSAEGLPDGWDWVYPTSISRSVIAYGILAAWLWVQLDRRPARDIPRLLWRAPVIYVLLGWALMFGLALVRGRVGELWAEHAGAILVRTAVHLVVGLGYVAMVHVALAALRNDGRVTDPA